MNHKAEQNATVISKTLFPGATVKMLVGGGLDILAATAVKPLDAQAQERLTRWFPNIKLVSRAEFEAAVKAQKG